MFEDFKEQIAEKQEIDAVKRVLSTATNRLSKATPYKYSTVDDIIEAVKFEHPTAAFVQIINLDQLNGDGFPTVTTRKIRDVKVVYSSTNTYGNRGALIGSYVNSVSFNYCLVLAFVKGGTFRTITQKIKGEGC